jgi:predicted alpha/beta-fold hydrolase
LFLAIIATSVACTLRPVSLVAVPDCHAPDAKAFFACVSRIPRPQSEESAFASTLRAANPMRKRRDQRLPSACEGAVPEGFKRIERRDVPPGRAPLHALFSPPKERQAIVIVVHGMFDSKFTKYVGITADLLRHQGFGILVPDMRWHGCLLDNEWLPTLGLEEGRDLVAWATLLRQDEKYAESRIGLVGFSLGGLSVLHALGSNEGPQVFQAGGVVVCPASGLGDTVEGLDSAAPLVDLGLTGLFRAAFRHYLRMRVNTLAIPMQGARFSDFLSWRVRLPPFGSGWTSERLLLEADPRSIVSGLKRPTLVLATSNDPIVPEIGYRELKLAGSANPYLYVLETRKGGHIGQIGLWPEWTATTLATFFRYSADVP